MFSQKNPKNYKDKNNQKRAHLALFLDFDEVINKSNEPAENGFVGGELIQSESLTELNNWCLKHNIPIYIVTNRADNDLNKRHIAGLLEQVGGFSVDKQQGGFKTSRIHFLGVETKSKGKNILLGVKSKKIDKVKAIQKSEIQDIDQSNIIIVDDDPQNLSPFEKESYKTILAKEENFYFKEVLELLKESLKTQKQQLQTQYENAITPASVADTSSSSQSNNQSLDSSPRLFSKNPFAQREPSSIDKNNLNSARM